MTILLRPLRMDTRAGRPIRNFQRLEQAPARLRAAAEIHIAAHPRRALRSATGVYNCIGLAFGSRRAWIDISDDLEIEVRKILYDDQYRQLPSDAGLEAGDIVLYRRDDGSLTHAAVVIAIPIALHDQVRVISQWGADGEYVHDVADVTSILGRPSEYWTDRRPLP